MVKHTNIKSCSLIISTGFIHNPNKDFSSKATAFLDDLHTYPITSSTVRNDTAQSWTSTVSLALSLFNVEDPYDTSWRMNFFRTYYQNENSEQEYGGKGDVSRSYLIAQSQLKHHLLHVYVYTAWNPNRFISFHQTECFGHVKFARKKHGCIEDDLPSMTVPNCNDGFSMAAINKRLGSLAQDFPEASVILCYTEKSLELIFKATGETSYLVNETMVNNDEIWRWTVMEAFIGVREHAPTRYLEFEVAPNNVTWIGFIHNPNKDFTSKATAFVNDLETYLITAGTVRSEAEQTWTSTVSLPLSMFNVADPVNTKWRMNFFRTFYRDENSDQEYGAWIPNKQISFHQTECFGHVTLGPSGSTDGQGSSIMGDSGVVGNSVNIADIGNAAENNEDTNKWDAWADTSGGTMDNQESRSSATTNFFQFGFAIFCMVLTTILVKV